MINTLVRIKLYCSDKIYFKLLLNKKKNIKKTIENHSRPYTKELRGGNAYYDEPPQASVILRRQANTSTGHALQETGLKNTVAVTSRSVFVQEPKSCKNCMIKKKLSVHRRSTTSTKWTPDTRGVRANFYWFFSFRSGRLSMVTTKAAV